MGFIIHNRCIIPSARPALWLSKDNLYNLPYPFRKILSLEEFKDKAIGEDIRLAHTMSDETRMDLEKSTPEYKLLTVVYIDYNGVVESNIIGPGPKVCVDNKALMLHRSIFRDEKETIVSYNTKENIDSLTNFYHSLKENKQYIVGLL